MRFLLLFSLLTLSLASWANQQNLDDLLQQVKQHQSAEKQLLQQREQRFLSERNQQKKLLDEARQRFLALQKQNNPLIQQSEAAQETLERLQQELEENIRDLGDIYSLYNEFSGDFTARLRDSMVNTQLSERVVLLNQIDQAQQLPSIEEMRQLLLLVQEEMTEAGKVRRYNAPITQADGSQKNEAIYRLGTFTLLGEQHLLLNLPEQQEITAQQNQPGSIARLARTFSQANQQGWHQAVIDPSRGSLLGLLDKSPNLQERIQQGAEVGYMIIALGIVGLLLAFYRLLYLALVKFKTQQQLKNIQQPNRNNPLGRVLLEVAGLQRDKEALQQRLNEAVLKEIPALERGHSLIKLMAAIAPLLGLLGTVVGMIATFQSISLFGSGDPKLMAGGISQALVTTVQGLLAAIPLLFCHNIVSSFSRSLVQLLDEQSAGIIASAFAETNTEQD